MVDQGDRAHHGLKVLIPKTLDLEARVPNLRRELLLELVKLFLIVFASLNGYTTKPYYKSRKSLVLVSLLSYRHVVETISVLLRFVSGNEVGREEFYYFLGSLEVFGRVVGLVLWLEIGSGRTRSRTPNHCFAYRFGWVVISVHRETVPD